MNPTLSPAHRGFIRPGYHRATAALTVGAAGCRVHNMGKGDMRAILCAVLAAAVGGTCGLAWADEQKVPLDKLPKAITAAVKKRFPRGEMTEASREDEDGKTVYEVTVKDGKQKIDVTLTPQGTITTLEKTIEPKTLPKAVRDALEARYPKAAYKIAEEVVRVKDGKETLDYYEALLETADKKRVEVEITADGKIKKTEDKTGKKD